MLCTFEHRVARACKAHSRVRWYSKTLSCSVCAFAVGCACKAPSRVQWYPKTAPSRAQCVFFFRFLFHAGRIHEARVSEKQKKEWPYISPFSSLLVTVPLHSWKYNSYRLNRRNRRLDQRNRRLGRRNSRLNRRNRRSELVTNTSTFFVFVLLCLVCTVLCSAHCLIHASGFISSSDANY